MKNKSLIRFFSAVIIMIMMFGSVSLSGSAATETDITRAAAKITTVLSDKAVKADDILTVTIEVSSNFFISNIQVPVLFDKTQFEIVGKTTNRTYYTASDMFAERNYLFGGRADRQLGFDKTSAPETWNTPEAKAQYGVAYITAAYDVSTGIDDSTYAKPENDAFATFYLKALCDVSDTKKSVFVSEDWAKTATNKQGLLTVGMTTCEDYYDENNALINYTYVSYTTETKTDSFDTSSLKPLRGTVSMKSYKGEDYLAITMAEGRTMTGIYKDMTDDGTVELVDICGNIQDRAGDYVAYQSQNKTNPVATMKVTYADGTIETYPVVFELYEMEREINFNPTAKIKPIRGKVSLANDVKGDYILAEMVEGQSSVGVYKTSLDGTTATLDGAEGMFTEQETLYIFYGSQNTFNPEGRLTVTETDGSQSTYRVVFKLYEMDPYVNAAKGLRPVRGAVTFDADGTIRIKMTKGQTSVGLYKTTANGTTFQLVDANGKLTNNASSLMFYMTNNVANVTAKIIFTLPDGTTKEQKIIFDMGLEDNPDPLVYLTAVRGTVSYKDDYIEVKANDGSAGVGLNKDCLVKYTLTDVDGVMTENDTRYYLYKSYNPDGATASINFLQSDGSCKTYTVKFVF